MRDATSSTSTENSDSDVPKTPLSRRAFVRAAGVGMAAGAALSSPMMASAQPQPMPKQPPPVGPPTGPFIDVRRFRGASDNARIQAAIAVAQKQGGGTVYLPAGKYVLNYPLRIASNGITLLGDSTPGTVLEAAREYSRGDMIVFENAIRGGVRQLSLHALEETRKGGAGIHIINGRSVVVQDVDMANMHTSCLIEGGILHHLDRGYWTGHAPDGAGIWVKEPMGNDIFISRIVMDHSTDAAKQPLAGLRITSTGAVWASDLDIIHAKSGLLVDPPQKETVMFCFFSNCAFDSCSERAATFQSRGGQIRSFHFVNSWFATSNTREGFFISDDTDGVQFSACRFVNNATHGLRVEGGARNILVDSSVAAGNNGAQNGSAGLSFATSGPFAARNNQSGAHAQFGVSQEHGIHVAPGCDHYLVSGNLLLGNKTAGLLDEGGANKAVANNLA